MSAVNVNRDELIRMLERYGDISAAEDGGLMLSPNEVGNALLGDLRLCSPREMAEIQALKWLAQNIMVALYVEIRTLDRVVE